MRLLIIYMLFALGGAAALIYQVAWMRSFRLVFGSTAMAASAVLAAWFLGMALGNFLGIRLARHGSALRRYGAAEIVIGLTALTVALWLALFRLAYPALYGAVGGTGGMTAVRLLLAFAALAVPTMAMGATLPLISHVVVESHLHMARRTGAAYGANLLGAVVGVVVGGFILPIHLGIWQCTAVAVGLNLLVGAAALLMARAAPSDTATRDEDDIPPGHPPARRRTAPVLVATLSGLGTLGLEVVYTRLLSHHSDNSVFTFGLMLAIFLVGLAVAAILVAAIGDRVAPWRLLTWSQGFGAMAIFALPVVQPFAHEFVMRLTPSDQDAAYAAQLTRVAAIMLLVLGPPVLLVGMALPLAWKIDTAHAREASQRVGVLTGINTVAAVAGSLVAGFMLLPALGVGRSLFAIGCIYVVLAALAGWQHQRGPKRCVAGGAGLVLTIAWWISGLGSMEIVRLDEGESIVWGHDGHAASVVVTEIAGDRKLRVNGHYILGSSRAAPMELLQSQLPLTLHPAPQRAAFIGVATGITVSGALDFPLERAVAVELVPGVVGAVEHFAAWNRDVFDDPRFELVVEDGRNYLLGTSETFDVIVGDLFVPWFAGTAYLYTVEHFEQARARLREGGIFAQWLPAYQLTIDELRTITASFLEVFPASTLWRNDFEPNMPIFALVGYRDGLHLDADAATAACRRLYERLGVATGALVDARNLEALYLWSDRRLAEWTAGAQLNTDNQPIIEFSTPRSLHHHQQRTPDGTNRLVAASRPRHWAYPSRLAETPSMDVTLDAADRLHDSVVAMAANNSMKAFDLLMQAVRAAPSMPAVQTKVLAAAAKFRGRQMTQRANALLEGLVDQEDPPVAALFHLARGRADDGERADAIALMARAVASAPEKERLRRYLVDLLKKDGAFASAEPHLRHLVEMTPEDFRLRLELAQALHRQGKKAQARTEVDTFREQLRRTGTHHPEAWRYLRTLRLGEYVDRPADAAPPEPAGQSNAPHGASTDP